MGWGEVARRRGLQGRPGGRLDHFKQFGVHTERPERPELVSSSSPGLPPFSIGGTSASRLAPEPRVVGDPISEVRATLDKDAGLFTNLDMIFKNTNSLPS